MRWLLISVSKLCMITLICILQHPFPHYFRISTYEINLSHPSFLICTTIWWNCERYKYNLLFNMTNWSLPVRNKLRLRASCERKETNISTLCAAISARPSKREIEEKRYTKKNNASITTLDTTYTLGKMLMSVFLYLRHTKYHNTHSTVKVRTFLVSEDILAGPSNFKGLFEGFKVWGYNWVQVSMRGLVVMVSVRIRGRVIHNAYESPHKDGSIRTRVRISCNWIHNTYNDVIMPTFYQLTNFCK